MSCEFYLMVSVRSYGLILEAAMSDETSEIREFLNSYTKLFDARDGAAIATYYHAPSISMRADASVHVFQTRRELQEFFQGVADKYHAEGQRRSSFVDLEVKPIGSESVLATLKWQMLREDGSTIRTWPQSYNLIRPNGRWQILASTIHI
jgi:ketosteroid isomerase-like protein